MARMTADVLRGLLAHLPPGWVWPRDDGSVLARTLHPLAAAIARIEAEAEAMTAEADPRVAVLLLDAWERMLGPDACGHVVASLPLLDRQRLAHARWIARGGQTPAYFVQLAAALGTAITVTEQACWQCGFSEAGDELVPGGEQFVWIVTLPADRLIDFEAGSSEAGDLLGDFAANLCECVIRLAAPAHTVPVFSYV